jgi:hypothetical protein
MGTSKKWGQVKKNTHHCAERGIGGRVNFEWYLTCPSFNYFDDLPLLGLLANAKSQ